MVTHSRMSSTKCPAVTREMVYARTRSLAFADGRAPQNVQQIDYERAKRELTGLSDHFHQEAMLDSTLWPD